ncbi:polysaccharide deacetylase [Nesterenkonia natronophila]|uniref:Polysaccharide deacetylase n=1 Tax=Nesterenkonia natronophila TaxID=2174932 RepID=A0A3A4FDJ7_9MICC|nr:polysaccharide deacetylase [Nesterenkonia natronophila]
MLGVGAVASVVVACSEPTTGKTSGPVAAKTPSPSASPSPSGNPSPSGVHGDGESGSDSLPSRDQIVEEYEGVSPGAFGLEVSGVKLSLPQGSEAVALTLDACGGPQGSAVDEALLETLRDLAVPVTLFINQRWAQANPTTMEGLVAEPLFEIQNHGTDHLPLSVNGRSAYGLQGTTSVAGVYDEIMGNQEFLSAEYGVTCRYFRSGTAHLDEASAQICHDLGITPVNFTINLDKGATLPAQTVGAQVASLSSADIALGHVNDPASGTGPGLAQALPQLLADDVRFITLEEAH